MFISLLFFILHWYHIVAILVHLLIVLPAVITSPRGKV